MDDTEEDSHDDCDQPVLFDGSEMGQDHASLKRLLADRGEYRFDQQQGNGRHSGTCQSFIEAYDLGVGHIIGQDHQGDAYRQHVKMKACDEKDDQTSDIS